MKIKVSRSPALSGCFTPPGDKSISHRAVTLGALTDGRSEFNNFLESDVTRVMVHSLQALGVRFEIKDHSLVVYGTGFDGFHQPERKLDCGHSGTTMRLLAGVVTAANLTTILDGSESLRRRPMSRVIRPLCQMGAQILSNDGKAPITMSRRTEKEDLQGITYEMPVASAQVKSAILIAGLAARGATTIIETGPSRDHTERMLKMMGVEITREKINRLFTTTLSPRFHRPLVPINFPIPGDFSSAAFIITAGLLVPGSDIFIKNVGLNWTRTGFLDVINNMGANCKTIHLKNQSEKQGSLHIKFESLKNINISGEIVVRMIDEFPAFAVLAAFSQGECLLKDASELRHKESDRIQAICQGLSKLGVQIEERLDGFRIIGHRGDLPGGVILDPGNDHRMAMALVLAGLRTKKPVIVKNAEIIEQSFPGFITTLKQLGAAKLEVLHD